MEKVTVDEAIRAASDAAWHVTDPGDDDYGRILLHCFRGSFGAAWDLPAVLAAIRSARSIQWINHLFGYELMVVGSDGGQMCFNVRRPAAQPQPLASGSGADDDMWPLVTAITRNQHHGHEDGSFETMARHINRGVDAVADPGPHARDQVVTALCCTAQIALGELAHLTADYRQVYAEHATTGSGPASGLADAVLHLAALASTATVRHHALRLGRAGHDDVADTLAQTAAAALDALAVADAGVGGFAAHLRRIARQLQINP